ncbi:hypothetical protein Goshw_027669 [Gossypium schwendimanii]|uniref:Uncharacterized protein n=1 Tax=Gossypium schwendimanii TaxID=34291 RepID=A0A7J9MYE3_GOSSC|nr:hypothetical protein [Gossypium schwendimanii]
MKFMKLGSKPDSFQTDGDHISFVLILLIFGLQFYADISLQILMFRYVATELATDIVVNVGDVKFYCHKFPLLSKSARLQKLVATSNDENGDELHIQDIPGGPGAFEICAKFCYGMTVTLNAYNVVAARCAAEYLEMYETVEKGNLIYKIDVFLNSSIFRSWKDSITVLQSTKSLLPWSEELKVVSRSLDSIASKASIDTSMVEWSYTYNRKKLPSENGNSPQWNGVRKQQTVPKDWWVEDLCELRIDLYKRVITTIKTKGRVSGDVIGEALNAYTMRRLPGFSKGMIPNNDIVKYRSLVETIVWLLPAEKGTVSCSFLLRLLRAAILLDCGETERNELMRRISQQLPEATVTDLLIRAPAGEATIYDVDIVHNLVASFMTHISQTDPVKKEFLESTRSPKFGPDASKVLVAKLIDGYLAEIARDPNLPVSKFVNLAEIVSSVSRPCHDGLYRGIDMYLKEHPGISKSERKRICRLMDCKKLSAEACMHAVQNERLPLRVVVQVLFFEQARATTSSGSSTPDLPGSIRALLPGGSHGSSRSTTTNTEEDWDSVPTAEDIKALKGELTTLRLSGETNRNGTAKTDIERVAVSRMKGLAMSKIFSKLKSSKERNGEISSSDTSESPEETKSTPSVSRKHSLS